MEIIIGKINKVNEYIALKTKHYISNLEVLERNQLANSKDYNELFTLAYKFGILPIVCYLYQYEKITYNYNLLSSTACTLSSETNGIMIPAESNGSKSSLNIVFGGKNQYGIAHCLKYLQYMKKYSKYISKNKQFYYTYNGKNMDNEVVERMLNDWIYQLCNKGIINDCKKDYRNENQKNDLNQNNI